MCVVGESWAGYRCCRWSGSMGLVVADGCAVGLGGYRSVLMVWRVWGQWP